MIGCEFFFFFMQYSFSDFNVLICTIDIIFGQTDPNMTMLLAGYKVHLKILCAEGCIIHK